MATKMRSDNMPDGVPQRLDSGGRTAMFVKGTPTLDPIRYSGNCPFWRVDLYSVAVTDETDPRAEPLTVCEFEDARLRISRRREAMPFTLRRIDADELHFVHKGRATFLTEAGCVEAPAGHFVFITRGVGYRIIPETDDYMSLIFESDDLMDLSENVEKVGIPLIRPEMPMSVPAVAGQTEWEEVMRTDSWSLSAIRPYDPVISTEVRQDTLPVFALDVECIPAHEPDGPGRGLPFVLLRGARFHLEVVMPTSAMPFYHRNVRANETQFVHHGSGDRFSSLGYVAAPEGTLNNYPRGIEHRVGERSGPCIGLIWETQGDVTLAPKIASVPADHGVDGR